MKQKTQNEPLNDTQIDLLLEYLYSEDKETKMLGVSLMKTDPNIKTFLHNNYKVYNVYDKYLYFDDIK